MTLQNKIALVTGASRGIGQAIALALARQGAIVIGTATTENGANSITQFLNEQGFKGQGMALNVANADSIKTVLEAIKSQYGVVEILINNAGVTRDNLLLRLKDEDWEEVINTDLTAVFRLSKACVRDMLKVRGGRIINISSVVGVTGNGGQSNYAAAKAGVIGFSKSLAQEIASRDITVNVIAPGFIDTDMTRALDEGQRAAILQQVPANRLGQPSDIADLVVFLASPQASYITGQTIHVNGGMYMA